MEASDNPNLDHGIEDQVGKDEIWIRVLQWFVERFELVHTIFSGHRHTACVCHARLSRGSRDLANR